MPTEQTPDRQPTQRVELHVKVLWSSYTGLESRVSIYETRWHRGVPEARDLAHFVLPDTSPDHTRSRNLLVLGLACIRAAMR